MSENEQTIAVDIGYGWVKGLTAGKTPVSFPSLVSPARDIRYDSVLGHGNGITVAVNGRKYFVGKKAELQGRGPAQSLASDRTGTDEMLALFYAACSNLVKVTTERVVVVTGLPVADFDKANRSSLKRSLRGRHLVDRDGRALREFEVSKVVVIPQAVGTLYGLVLDKDGRVTQNQDLQYGKVAVVDVGQFTTNFVTLDSLRFIDILSTSQETGVSRILLDLQRELRERYGLSLEKLTQVDQAVRDGFVTVRGKRESIVALVEPQIDALADLVLTQARSLWNTGADLTAVVLTGGGASLLTEHVTNVYSHTRVDESGQFGNVQGYLRLALFNARG